jgi:hypothetical protein
MLARAAEHGLQLDCAPLHVICGYCVHNITMDWALIIRAVDLAVPEPLGFPLGYVATWGLVTPQI